MRAYEPGDLAWLMDTANRAWQPIYRAYRTAYGEELFPILVPNVETRKGEEMRRLCANEPSSIYVCVEGGRRVGFIHISMDHTRRMGVIGNNAVDPGCGLKGIGQEMYRFALGRFREAGMTYASVTTGLDEGHAPARRAYERAGFDISHSDIHYYMKLG
jgi:ribosomal protein S18 acetylase RimI-like enzyme